MHALFVGTHIVRSYKELQYNERMPSLTTQVQADGVALKTVQLDLRVVRFFLEEY